MTERSSTTTTAAGEILDAVKQKFGFVPNVLAEASQSPLALSLYVEGQGLVARHAQLTPAQQQAVMLAISATNRCDYCTAVHVKGSKGQKVSEADIAAIRGGARPADPSLAGVTTAARLLVEKRGWLDTDDLTSLEADGVSRALLYDIIALIGIKTVSNYVNHISHVEIDSAFRE